MASTDANQVDTSGVVGNPGAADDGTADQVHDLSNPPKPGEQETANAGAGGGGAVPAPPAQNQPDTEGLYGANLPSNYHPTDTSLHGTTDTTLPGVANADPAYRAPSLQPGAGQVDTTWTDRLGSGPAPTTDSGQEITGTTETGYFGAPAGSVTVQTDTGLTINAASSTALTHPGVVPGSISVQDTTASKALVLGTDYTVSFSGSGADNTASIRRVGTSTNSADGDSVTVTYSTGDAAYFEGNLPANRPSAPTGVTATGHRGYVTVAWAAPTAGEIINGYRVENDADGVYFAPANATSFDFTQLTWEQPYKFRVAAQNARGVGPYSAWTAAATATTPNAAWAGLDPKNTVNPIYNPDGTIKPGTGGT